MTVSTRGSIEAVGAQALGSSEVERVNIRDGLITAQRVVAVSGSAANGVSAASNAEGSTIVGLVVNGVPHGDGLPAPNTTIGIPGGVVILNEQAPRGDGVTTTGLSVNMIHVVLSGELTGDIVVGSGSSGVSFSP
jgi:hypothetical protein